MSNFEDVRIVDNFYQTSSFFPMPTVLIGTYDRDEKITNLGSYSLCFPYYIAGKDCYAMVLECRNNSNTARNILNTGRCSINFVTDKKKHLKEVVRLGFPGETTAEKMAKCSFTLVDGAVQQKTSDETLPQIVDEAFQVFECTWLKDLDGATHDTVQEEYAPPYHDFNGITSEMGAHFILKIDKILLKPKYKKSIINGVTAGGFPSVPVDYGYRDNTNFWLTKFRRAFSIGIPKGRGMDLGVITYAADRIDDKVKFTDGACKTLTNVPRIFLNTILKSCVAWAKENNVTLITEVEMKIISDKRAKEKSAK